MEEITKEISPIDSISKTIEEGNKEIENVKITYADEIDELIKKTLTKEDIDNFTVPELTDEQLKSIEATEDDIKLYKIARILEHDKENKLDVENYIDKDLLNTIITNELNIKDIPNKEERNKAIKSYFLFKAYGLYMMFENAEFANKVKDISTNVDTDEILKTWFKHNNDLFGITEDLEFLEEKEKNEFSIGREAYKRALTMETIIDQAKKTTLKKLIKECSDKRYKRHVDRFNMLIRHHLRQQFVDKESKTTNCDNLPLYTSLIIGLLYKNKPEDKETIEEIIKNDKDHKFSRSIVVLMSLASNTMDLSTGDVVEPYFINMNLYMISNIPTLSDSSDKCTKRIVEAVYEIMKIILNKDEKDD